MAEPAASDTAKHRASPDIESLVAGVRGGDRAALGQAITLLESALPAHEAQAQALLSEVLNGADTTGGQAHRLGITGAPGAGKSTFIEALGKHLTGAGHKVAVLAVDPSSQVSGGSILGDKTRMQELARDPNAFIRPSPSRGTLGGVASRTREAILLCEAAGYDVVIVETVGTGQSEAVVAGMVDAFLVLLLAGAGDELQGIKRGVLELADVLAVNKADGDNVEKAKLAAAEYRQALGYLRPRLSEWKPPVLTLSALTGAGVPELWETVKTHRAALQSAGTWQRRRREQRVAWMWELVDDLLRRELRAHAADEIITATEADVEAGRLAPGLAARRILEAFTRRRGNES